MKIQKVRVGFIANRKGKFRGTQPLPTELSAKLKSIRKALKKFEHTAYQKRNEIGWSEKRGYRKLPTIDFSKTIHQLERV